MIMKEGRARVRFSERPNPRRPAVAEAGCLNYAAIRMGKAARLANLVTLHMVSLCALQDTQLAYMQASPKQVN